MKRQLLISLLFLGNCFCFAQERYPTQDAVHIFWQPDLKLKAKDYQGKPMDDIDKLMDEYRFSASASVGVWYVLDIPKKKKDRYTKFEKVYYAPAFEKTTSYTRSNDSLQIAQQNLYFDICEISARWARKELNKIQDSIKATGTLSIFFMTVNHDMNRMKQAMFRAYFKEVFMDKKVGAFEQWRERISKTLADTKRWETTPQECYRFIRNEPIEEGYIKAPTVTGVLHD